MRLVYVAGEPGSGKSTLVDRSLARPLVAYRMPFAHRVTADEVHVLGPAGDPFGGTDKLSMSVQPRVVGWLAGMAPARVLGEGDRLANLSFLRAARDLGYDVTLVHLYVPESVAEERRQARASEHGLGPQDASWVAGRRTKVRNLVDKWDGSVQTFDGRDDLDELVEDLRRLALGG